MNDLMNEYFKTKPQLEKIRPDFNPEFLQNKRILILDDNVLNVELLEETLSPLKLDIHSFIKPQEAIKSLQETKYDLFLLDIMMPEISGFDVAQVIKNDERNKKTPIVFISALSDAENKIRGYDLGSIAYIEKPFNVSVVQSQIYNILKSKALQDALEETKETFLAMVTHDLKTPIHAEICALELLLKNHETKPLGFTKELLSDMLNTSKYMKNLVENLLIKYKSENDEIILQLEPYPLERIIRKCLEEMQYIAREKNLKIKFKNSVKEDVCNIDFVEIKRAINNLLSNAVQYSIPKTVITVELKETPHDFLIEIINTGSSPISKDLSANMFEKLVQNAQNTKTINLGLGLYICKKIIELHHGKIFCEPTRSGKNKFCFTLPKSTPRR